MHKRILKSVASRYLPDDIVFRRKSGFGAPIRAWLQRELRDHIQEMLNPDRLRHRGIVDPDVAQRIIRNVLDGKDDNALHVWALLCFEVWAETFIDNNGGAAVSF
jgi:asparagine synthase (glutamine-hydrolysing)